MVAAGWDTITACAARTRVTWAPARCAMKRWVAGGIARSCVATRNHEGSVFHAGSPEGSANAAAASGRHLPRPHRVRDAPREVAGEAGAEALAREIEIRPRLATGHRVRALRHERLGPDEAAGVAGRELAERLALVRRERGDVYQRLTFGTPTAALVITAPP